MRSPCCFHPIAGFALVFASSGCAGTVVVDYDVEVDAFYLGASDSTVRTGKVVSIPPTPHAASPFETQMYDEPRFSWRVGTGTLGLGGAVRNKSAGTLCFEFSQADLSSNFARTPERMEVSHWADFRDGRWRQLGTTKPPVAKVFSAPDLCIRPDEKIDFSFAPDFRGLFPNNTLFNVRWDGERHLLDGAGKGSWLKITVPVRDGKRVDQFNMVVTAKASKARMAYY